MSSQIRPRHPGFVIRQPGYENVLPAKVSARTIVDVGALFDSTDWLHERFPEARIIATNVLERHLESIPDEWAEKRMVRAEEMDELPPTDLIFLGEVLEHLVYPQEFLARAVASLRIGGLLLLSTPNLTTWHNRLLMLLGYSPSNYSMLPGQHLGVPTTIRKVAGSGYGDHIRVFSYRALRELFSTPPWELVGITGRSDLTSRRPYYRARIALSRMIPESARETVFLCARLISKEMTMASSTGFIGSNEFAHA